MPNETHNKSTISRRTLLVLGGLASAGKVLARGRLGTLSEFGWSRNLTTETENEPACIYWNARARQLVAKFNQDPVYASRTYALLSLTQAIAAQLSSKSDVIGIRDGLAPQIISACISSASVHYLSVSFPESIDAEQSTRALTSDLSKTGLDSAKIKRVTDLGVETAKLVINRRAADGADREVAVIPPKGPSVWVSLEAREPVRPYWGMVKPLCLDSVEKFIPGPPPNIDGPDFKAALAQVREINSKVTPEQEKIIHYWADSAGTPTPSGHWNQLACDYLSKTNHDEIEKARILALLNIAMFDAGVVCWGTKYKYWLARPSQLDPNIVPRLRVPNFPSFFSGHSAFSSAAAAVLSHFFTNERAALESMAKQASESRVLCGIHYKFDCEAGLRSGSRIGEYTVKQLASSKSLTQLLKRAG